MRLRGAGGGASGRGVGSGHRAAVSPRRQEPDDWLGCADTGQRTEQWSRRVTVCDVYSAITESRKRLS